MVTELVIARYNEDISWLKNVKNKKITVYNKGIDNINIKSIKLPNVGRESHTYLTHIINNYDNLADTTIFCQGDPFFHSQEFLKLIEYSDYFEPIQPLTRYYSPSFNEASNKNRKIIINKDFVLEGLPPKQVTFKTKNLWINNIRIYVEYYNKDGVVLYPAYYRDYFIMWFIKSLKYKFKFKSIVQFMKDRYKLDNISTDILVPMSYAAIFSVTRDVICQRSIDFYKNILNLLLEDYSKYNVDTGLLLERLWLSIFNYQKNNSNYKKLYSKDFKINYYQPKIINNYGHIIIKSLLPIYIILQMDNKMYTLLIGYKSIFFNKYNSYSIAKMDFKEDIFKRNEYTDIKMILDKYFKVYINNQLRFNLLIKEKELKKIKVEESYMDIKNI
jgi:hypothetical protein